MESKAMIKLAYFAANFNSNFIEECWKNDLHLIEHLKSKLRSHSNGSFIDAGGFIHFFYELSRNHQILLCEYILENYDY